MWSPDQLRGEVERARRVAALLNDAQSRQAIEQYVTELESEVARLDNPFALARAALS